MAMSKEPFSMRMAADLRAALDRAADAADRPASYVVTQALRKWLADHGYIAKPAGRSAP
jgi:predicted transcriptional regulator